uniref:Protein kinase domain-containing protein n=1 Tax=Hemiselmis andersenii TaxID=464988 RepID=A0A6U2ALD6_HEMAN
MDGEAQQHPLGPSVTASVERPDMYPVRWKAGRQLGAGAFGRVFEGMNEETGDFLAVKEVQMYGSNKEIEERAKALEREISIMARLRHPNIVRYLGCDHKGDKVFIFMEIAPKGSVASVIAAYGKLSEGVSRKYCEQMLKGLAYLHGQEQPVIHRDIKGANVLIWDSGVVKLADFGASKRLNQLSTMSRENKSMIGTPYWMAPEVIRESGHGRKADIWSVGCTCIEMLTGRPPWSEFDNPITALFQIASASRLPAMPEGVSPECTALITLCLGREPSSRPSAQHLVSSHPWITGRGDASPAVVGPEG